MKIEKYLLSFGIILMNSACVVQYNVTDTNTKLKSSVESVNANCLSIFTQIEAMQKEYLSLKCKTDAEPYQTAQQLLIDINTSLTEVQKLKTDINNEYSNFSDFTKGKSTIASNTPEWKKLKLTKKKMKSYIKSLQNKGEETIKKATTFNEYATTKIVPIVSFCDVPLYLAGYKQTIEEFKKVKKNAATDFTKYQSQVLEAANQFRKSQPNKIQILTEKVNLMQAELNRLDIIEISIQKAVDEFKKESKGKQKIYSCSSDYDSVLRVESAISGQQIEINNLQNKIQSIALEIQNTINTLE